MKKISTKDISENLFKLIDQDWFLITSENEAGQVNAMTAQWATVGHLWMDDIVIIFVRQARYSHQYLTEGQQFSIAFFKPEDRPILKYMGSHSGADGDKFKAQGLTVGHEGGCPYPEQARLVLNCEKIYVDTIKEACFIDREIDKRVYPQKDYHTVFIGRITSVLLDEGVQA